MDAAVLYPPALAAHLGAHLWCVAAVFRAPSTAGVSARLRGAALAAVVPPLAPFQAWRAGNRRAALTWVGSFIGYGAVLALVS